LFFGGFIPSIREIPFDYTPYLGPNYKEQPSIHKVSTIVSNHCCWTDVLIYIASRLAPAFASKNSLRKKPIIGLFTQALQCIFIARGASQEERD